MFNLMPPEFDEIEMLKVSPHRIAIDENGEYIAQDVSIMTGKTIDESIIILIIDKLPLFKVQDGRVQNFKDLMAAMIFGKELTVMFLSDRIIEPAQLGNPFFRKISFMRSNDSKYEYNIRHNVSLMGFSKAFNTAHQKCEDEYGNNR